MKTEIHKIDQFEKDQDHFQSLELLLTIKSFDLQAIRKRYIASKKNKSGKAGSVERRPVSIGGVVWGKIEKGSSLSHLELTRMKEPRGIDSDHGRLAIAAEDRIYIYDQGESYDLKYPWFSYIHTVKFSPFDPNRVLIASSGLDMLIEMNYRTAEVTFEWLAWENGFQVAHDPKSEEDIFLTRSPGQYEEWIREGKRARLIEDPRGQVLPTAMRAAFINSIAYDPNDPDQILATFFHEGKVFKIDRASGVANEVVTGLRNPHGGMRHKDHYFATSTASGEIILQNKDERIALNFQSLAGKPPELDDLEWLQNSISLPGFQNAFLTIDSNRNQFICVDLIAKKRAHFDYDLNWAVQDLITLPVTDQHKNWIQGLNTKQ